MSQGELAKAVGLPRSTVQRIVAALGQENLIQPDRSDGVRLGSALLRLVARVHTDVVSIVAPHLTQLSRDVEESVTLGRMSGREFAFVHVVVSDEILRVVPRVGSDLPLHSTAGGRALLSLQTDDSVRALLGTAYKRATPSSLHTYAELTRELERIRECGYALESDETFDGVSSVAFAIDTVLGHYSVSIVLPTARVDLKRDRLIEQALRMKKVLATQLGATE